MTTPCPPPAGITTTPTERPRPNPEAGTTRRRPARPDRRVRGDRVQRAPRWTTVRCCARGSEPPPTSGLGGHRGLGGPTGPGHRGGRGRVRVAAVLAPRRAPVPESRQRR